MFVVLAQMQFHSIAAAQLYTVCIYTSRVCFIYIEYQKSHIRDFKEPHVILEIVVPFSQSIQIRSTVDKLAQVASYCHNKNLPEFA